MTSPRSLAASLLIAWTLSATAPAWAAETPQPELLITGLFINDEEHQGADIYQQGERFWIPLEQLSEWANIQVDTAEKRTTISTPLGDGVVAANNIRLLDELTHIDMAALKDVGIHARFDQAAYALVIYAPWIGIKPQTAALANSPREPDYKPQQVGTSRLYNRFDSSYSREQKNNGLYSDAFGHLANGVWGLQTTVDNEYNTQLGQLYWHTFNRYAALRLGTTKANPGPLLDSPDYTGLQLGFSNLSVYSHLAANTSVSRQMFIDDASYSHDISGEGPKGGIAELRLNQRPIARVRIALDGRYLFKRLPVTKGATDRVEVALYEYSLASPPLRVVDYTIASKPRAVSTGEWMFNAGVGATGSTLEDSAEGASANYGSLRYGVSNFLTLETAALHQEDGDNGWYAGIITSLGPHVSSTLGRAQSGDTEKYGAELNAHWSSATASLNAQREKNTAADTQSESSELSARWKLNKDFSAIAKGMRNTKESQVTEEYLGLGFDWHLSPRSTLSVLPVGDKQYDSRLSLRSLAYDANVQLRAKHDSYGLSINYALSNALSVGWDFSQQDEDANVISAAADYRPRHNNDSVFSAQVSQQSQEIGYSLGWRHRLSPRTQFDLSYYRHLEDESVLLEEVTITDTESLVVSIESELWFSRRGWRGAAAKTDSTHGAISARVLDASGTPINSQDIRLQIEGAASTLVPSSNGEQSLAGLPPGDYNLKLLADGLPIEYESNATNFRVRVAPAATTAVEITLKPHFGVSGLLTHNGQAMPYTWVEVWQDGSSVADGKTDGYGYYQIAGLLPGSYELRYKDVRSSFELLDEYLFDINVASGIAPPASQALALEEHAENEANAEHAGNVYEDTRITHEVLPDLAADLIDLGTLLPAGLSGRVYYEDEPLGHVSVQLHTQDRKIASVISDSYGYFSFHHLSPGEYTVSAGISAQTYTVGGNRTYGADIHLFEKGVSGERKSLWTAK